MRLRLSLLCLVSALIACGDDDTLPAYDGGPQPDVSARPDVGTDAGPSDVGPAVDAFGACSVAESYNVTARLNTSIECGLRRIGDTCSVTANHDGSSSITCGSMSTTCDFDSDCACEGPVTNRGDMGTLTTDVESRRLTFRYQLNGFGLSCEYDLALP